MHAGRAVPPPFPQLTGVQLCQSKSPSRAAGETETLQREHIYTLENNKHGTQSDGGLVQKMFHFNWVMISVQNVDFPQCIC